MTFWNNGISNPLTAIYQIADWLLNKSQKDVIIPTDSTYIYCIAEDFVFPKNYAEENLC
jgi:hypothetical protein